jgi:hypothetical protein
MEPLLLVFAAVGCAAAFRHLLWSAFRAARYGAYVLYAREIAATRARRGDLTGLEEARVWVGSARRERLQAMGRAGFWLALLLLPATLLSRSTPVYAAYTLFWLIPAPAWRRGGPDAGAPNGEWR